MRRPPLGTGLRAALFFVAVGSITATTWLYQLLFARPDVGLPGAIAAVMLPAALGVVSGFYALRG